MLTGMTYYAVVTTTIRLRFSFDSISIRLSFDVERQSNGSRMTVVSRRTGVKRRRVKVESQLYPTN